MDNFDLKQYLTEGILTKETKDKSNHDDIEETNTSLITFEQLKQACIENYNEYSSRFTDDGEIYDDGIENELNQASDIDELVNILDGLGFNGNEAYNFIFDSILK